jgi:hypothetical protein
MEFEEDNNYEPNEVQAEFLRLVAEEFNYVALGDTDHRRPIINKFALNPRTIRALADGGTKNLFLEMAPGWQPYIDQVSGKSSDPRTFNYSYGDANMWLCEDSIRQALTDNFERSASSNPDVNFIAADARHTNDSDYDEFTDKNKWTLTVPMSIYMGVYGCMAPQGFIIPMIAMAATGRVDEFDTSLKDDHATAEGIMAYEGDGAIFYGAGHFTYEVGSKRSREASMRTILQEDGKTLALINVFQDIEQDDFTREGDSQPDAILYVNEHNDNPDGILAFTPEMKALEKRAHDNVSRSKALTQ